MLDHPKIFENIFSKNSYTTNVVNGNILVEDKRIRLPKLKWISMEKHWGCLESSQYFGKILSSV